MNRSFLPALALAVGVLLCATAASAEPYELYAQYDPIDPSGAAVQIVLKPGISLPRGTETHKFTGVHLRSKSDDISRMTMCNLRNFVWELECSSPSCGGVQRPFEVGHGSTPAGCPSTPVDVLIITPEDMFRGADRIDRLTIRIHAKLAPDYLCGQETALRGGKDNLADDWKSVIPYIRKDAKKAPKDKGPDLSGATPDELAAIGFLAHKVGDIKTPVLWSFCAGPRNAVHWEQGLPDLSTKESDDERRARAAKEKLAQHRALGQIVAKRLNDEGKLGTVTSERDAAGLPENVSIRTEHRLSVVREVKEVLAFESTDRTRHGWLHHTQIVAQGATIRLARANDACRELPMACDDFVRTYLSATIEEDASGATVKSVPLLRDDTGWAADIALKDYLRKKVKLTLWYKYNDGADARLALRTDRFTVEDLGLVTSFPLVTELVTAVKASAGNAPNPTDQSYSSSIPISWAFNAKANDGRHLAITFPWLIGYNPREAPRLADYVKVFPHMSVVLPLSGSANSGSAAAPESPRAQIAFGAGLQLVNSFSAAWGMATDTGANYVLLGVSVPDLVSAFK